MPNAQDVLGGLTPYFADDFDLTIPSVEFDELLAIFKQHFIEDGVLFEGERIWVEVKRSNMGVFRAFPQTFVHIVSREQKNGKREFDQVRAKRLHWIKPILLHSQDARVRVFARTHDTGKPQTYFWFKDLSYVVILRTLTARKQLLTAFCVDEDYEKKCERWWGQGAVNKKPHLVCGARIFGQCD